MKNTKIVLVAAWDGWCASCAVERPLVLTRSGRLGLRTWLTAPAAESRPLTLTCRLCGFSDLVPSEADDPPVLLTDPSDAQADAPPVVPAAADGGTTPAVVSLAPAGAPVLDQAVVAPVTPSLAPATAPATPSLAPAAAPVTPSLAPATAPAAAVRADAELARTRHALGAALGALLAQRTAHADQARPVLVAPPVSAVARPALPLQRTAPSDGDSLTTLQLLADGLDLLGSSRS